MLQFGSDIISWLRGLLNINIKPTFHHDYSDTVTAIILRDQWDCSINPQIKLNAKIDATATASIKLSSSFGMTIITKLGPNMDLRNSYVFLKTSGDISTIFTVDALARTSFDSGEFTLATLPFPGATFSIPKLLTVGPKFVLNAQATADVEIAGHFEAKVDIASWDFRQTYPEASSEFDPVSLRNPARDFDVKGLKQPTFDASVVAQGQMTAHLRPTLSFGIEFDPRWGIGKCTAELAADGFVRLRAQADLAGGDAMCPFRYAIDAGAKLTARAAAPDAFHWTPRSIDFFPIERNLIPGDGSNWKCVGSGSLAKRDEAYLVAIDRRDESLLLKRGPTYGPFFRIPQLACPGGDGNAGADCSSIKGWTDDQLNDPDASTKRDVTDQSWRGHVELLDDVDVHRVAALSGNPVFNETGGDHLSLHEKRGGSAIYDFCVGDAKMSYKTPPYPDGTNLYDCVDWGDCNNFNLDIRQQTQTGHRYVNEHILEVSMSPSPIYSASSLSKSVILY
jgi:chitinase